jgi:HD domain
MALTPSNALKILKDLDFHLYYAKSSNESLLIHSFSVYSLVHEILPFTQTHSDTEKELMRWAALLHDYGKTSSNWQKAKRGPHRVSLGDTKYEELLGILDEGITRYSEGILTSSDIEDILFIIEFHHGSGRGLSTPSRNRIKDVVSECDRAVSQNRISEDLIRALNAIVDTVRYRFFTIELIEHPISPLIIGAFDYVLSETERVWPLLYSSTSTLYLAETDVQLPSLDEVNAFLNDQIGESKGVLRYDGGNTRIYVNERSFLELAFSPEKFITQATAYANTYCVRKRKAAEKRPDSWSDAQEEVYLYGRVCGATYNTILDLCKAPIATFPRACLMAGGFHGPVTVSSLELLGLRRSHAGYEQTLREILARVQPLIGKLLKADTKSSESDSEDEAKILHRYDVRELIVPGASVYPRASGVDPKAEALEDYERYWSKQPLKVCPTCNHFKQGNVTAAAFPRPSPLGGTVEVFYTAYMRLIKKEAADGRGVSFCDWCSKWWELIASDADGKRNLYHFCVMPHHLFARLDWQEILQPDESGDLVELGSPGTVSASGVYPHVAMLHLRGQDRNALLRELVANPMRGEEQIVDRLNQYGLRGTVITTNPVSSRHLITLGSIRVDTSEWPLLRGPLRLLHSAKRPYTRAIRALQLSPYAFGTLLADGSIPITKKTEREIKTMVNELAENTGLSFLQNVWVQGGIDEASKVIRGMNETLRRLKGKEDNASLVDAMVGKGLHLALSTRKGKLRSKENRPKEEAALRQAAEKLLQYRDQTYRRTELVRAMIYTLAYFSKPEDKPEDPTGNATPA